MDYKKLLTQLQQGDTKALARSISLVENEQEGYQSLLESLPNPPTKIIGITGAPGAGKSTLVDALIEYLVNAGKRVGVICVDPSSAFNLGAVLGDRVRMSSWYTNPHVFIRSLATRGSMGGLNPRIIEITDLMKAFPFDHIIVETVGVGQSEIEIAGLADITVVVMVPEAGDEVQTMKAGVMEIADVFVVNKADRPDADILVKNLRLMLAPAFSKHYNEVPILKTIASQKEGVKELAEIILHELQKSHLTDKRFWLLAEKAYWLIQQRRMKDISREILVKEIEKSFREQKSFNLYQFVSQINKTNDLPPQESLPPVFTGNS
jgi:LAO/AO transport system kinase